MLEEELYGFFSLSGRQFEFFHLFPLSIRVKRTNDSVPKIALIAQKSGAVSYDRVK
jgi:hypothetical protein